MLVPQLLVSAKLPVMVTLVTATALLLALVTVTAWGALVVPVATPEKVRLAGDTETLVLVPDKLTVCGLPLALSAIDRVLVAGLPGGSNAVGVKITVMVQALPSPRLVPQVLV